MSQSPVKLPWCEDCGMVRAEGAVCGPCRSERVAVRKLGEPVHYCVHSSNGHDMEFACGIKTEWPVDGPSPRVHRTDDGLYTFDRGKVTCGCCLSPEVTP